MANSFKLPASPDKEKKKKKEGLLVGIVKEMQKMQDTALQETTGDKRD